MDGMVEGAHDSQEPAQGFTPGLKVSRPLTGLCQVGGRSQDSVLRTASWAKFNRPFGTEFGYGVSAVTGH